eukprot:TRINITY_DN9658_c0_g1_i1.p1 TRINITY_DN9658_c0_g1~~TRINITY_DN9658_c0_g1_i1.p1  ORF type:complete len:160 (-),score=18.24 TRINITY_DN9658_c0_g1_i1:152-631(-)
MTKHFASQELDKTKEITCSDWDNDVLTEDQVLYAAADAFYSLKVFCVMMTGSLQNEHEILREEVETFTQGHVDVRAKRPARLHRKKDATNRGHQQELQEKRKAERYELYVQRASRARPLYENCVILNHVGDLLSTCSRKTLQWYLKKGLADVIDEKTFS